MEKITVQEEKKRSELMKEIFLKILFYSYVVVGIIAIVVSVIFLVQLFWFKHEYLKAQKEKYWFSHENKMFSEMKKRNKGDFYKTIKR